MRNKFKIYKKVVLHLWRMGLTGEVWYQLCCTMIFESRLYRSALMRYTREMSGSGWSFERWHSELCYQLLSLGIEQQPGEVLNELIEEAEEEQMKTEYLLEREVDLVLSALTDTNRLVMRTALVTGLRVGDVLALKPDRLKSHFWVTEQKTGKKRQVGLPEPLLSDLKKNAGKYWVFPGRDPKKHHTRQAVWKDVKRAAKAFRLPQNVAPHSARKIYAVDLMKKYGDLKRVRNALNHSSDSVTLIYALADQQLAAKNKRRAARAGRTKR